MMGNKQTQAEYSKGAKTPEEAFDRQMLSGNYMMFLIVALFLVVGVEGYVGLMPQPVVVGVAGIIACLAAGFLAVPLFWELDNNSNRFVRRIRRAAYFPIRKRAFVLSKLKLMSMYGGILWLVSLVIQLLFAPLFGLGNILLYQGTLAAVFAVNVIAYTVIGTAGARLGE